jgi:hypothetical protein
MFVGAAGRAAASTFAWTYSGAPCTVEICKFGPDVFPPQAMTGSGYFTTSHDLVAGGTYAYTINSFTGTWNGFAITGLLSTTPGAPDYFYNDNKLIYPLSSKYIAYVDVAGLGFSVADGTAVNLAYDITVHSYVAFASNDPPYGDNTFTGGSFGSFTVAPVPETTTWAMLLTGFAAIGAMAYRRKARPAASAG